LEKGFDGVPCNSRAKNESTLDRRKCRRVIGVLQKCTDSKIVFEERYSKFA
jgi:hypothetical protein